MTGLRYYHTIWYNSPTLLLPILSLSYCEGNDLAKLGTDYYKKKDATGKNKLVIISPSTLILMDDLAGAGMKGCVKCTGERLGNS